VFEPYSGGIGGAAGRGHDGAPRRRRRGVEVGVRRGRGGERERRRLRCRIPAADVAASSVSVP
jgi:hypothetical protein